MQAIAGNDLMLALFNLGGGEIILVLAMVLVLAGAKKLPQLARGLGQGLTTFRDATKDILQEMDDEASEAGRSVGGIYGKPAAQALTSDNQVAELYDPAVLRDEPSPHKTLSGWRRLIKNLWCRVLKWLGRSRAPALRETV